MEDSKILNYSIYIILAVIIGFWEYISNKKRKENNYKKTFLDKAVTFRIFIYIIGAVYCLFLIIKDFLSKF
jgi:prolipoprotein diacylglyceryltransferase